MSHLAAGGRGTVSVSPLPGSGQREGASLGKYNVVELHSGYHGLTSSLSQDEDIGTRLGEPTITLRLARRVAGRLEPWAQSPDMDAALAWALSEIRVRAPFWGDSAPPAEDATLHADARRHWPDWEDAIRLVEVSADGQLRVEGGVFSYSAHQGLERRTPSNTWLSDAIN